MSALCLTDLDRPAFRDRGESPGPGGASGDFEVDAEGGGVLDEVLTVAAGAPHLADCGVSGGNLVEEGSTCGGVLDTMIRRYIIWRNRHADGRRLRAVVDRANVA
jgi:hypothetical protein